MSSPYRWTVQSAERTPVSVGVQDGRCWRWYATIWRDDKTREYRWFVHLGATPAEWALARELAGTFVDAGEPPWVWWERKRTKPAVSVMVAGTRVDEDPLLAVAVDDVFHSLPTLAI